MHERLEYLKMFVVRIIAAIAEAGFYGTKSKTLWNIIPCCKKLTCRRQQRKGFSGVKVVYR